ncbi:DUF2497 domain-containing protein [Novosphingobium sp.]|uniref:DUF2497 domain-containing protein n=1 Tax=Novosphingobium sp. TaxID=1874826 RepID=UPI003D103038
MRQAGEPSVEEILSSIKKVIARDSRIDAGKRDGARIGRGNDVLDLSEVAAQVLAAPPAADEPDTSPDTNPDSGSDGDALLGEETTAAMRDSLAALAMLAQPGARPQIVRSGETSLEGLVREMLRPMLADWLDQNLPPMVEQMVGAEIARIVQKKT